MYTNHIGLDSLREHETGDNRCKAEMLGNKKKYKTSRRGGIKMHGIKSEQIRRKDMIFPDSCTKQKRKQSKSVPMKT
jgi:hypothetical protein